MFLTSFIPSLDDLTGANGWFAVVRSALIFAILLFAAGAVIRMCLGKGANLTRAVSACLTILLVYLASVLLYLFLPGLRTELAQLPFVYVDSQRFILRNLSDLSEPVLFGSLVRLGMLAFLVNLLESLLPEGDDFWKWYLWRGVTVIMTLALYGFLADVLEAAAPKVFTEWAKWLILGCWTFILLSGALHWITGAVLAVVNPVLGALYAFFFSHVLGSQFSKSILTTLILTGLVAVLNYAGFRVFAFADFSLAAYGPTCLIVIAAMYLFGKFL